MIYGNSRDLPSFTEGTAAPADVSCTGLHRLSRIVTKVTADLPPPLLFASFGRSFRSECGAGGLNT